VKRALFSTALALTLLAGAGQGEAAVPVRPSAQALWDAWPGTRVSPPDPWALRQTSVHAALDDLQTRHPGLFTIVEEGVSSEGRRIPLLKVGNGPKGILLWSQMHGDEPTATAALLDLLNWLGAHRSEPAGRQLLSNLTLWIIPMLNPDGAERTQRRNAQEIDINRDALRLASPEGRFLKSVRDRVKPVLGYNLHNQNPNLLAGRNGSQVAIALLSVPGDEALTETDGTRRTKRLAVAVQRLLAPFAAGRISRYDMDYTARAFGDSMTRWGTATLLIETGGWAGPGEAERLIRLNFVALLGSLTMMADGSVETIPADEYARIPMNVRDSLFTLVLRHARVAGGRGLPPFTADLAFVVPGPFAGDEPRRHAPALKELGDLSHARGLTEVDATGLLALPWPEPLEGDWPSLKASLRARNLVEVEEAGLLAAVRAFGEDAVARPGYGGPILLYRALGAGRLSLEGAVIHGSLAGEPRLHAASLPAGPGAGK